MARGGVDDPTAPAANSIVVAVTVFVLDEADRVLLIRRTDNDLWALPGGAQDVGEYIAQTAVRETREETGVDIEVVDVVGIYSNPNHVVEYSDGEVRQQFSICFRARYLAGEPTVAGHPARSSCAPSGVSACRTVGPSRCEVIRPAARRIDACWLAEATEMWRARASWEVPGASAAAASTAARVRPSRSASGLPVVSSRRFGRIG